ncbi:MAG TPA: hypothetical protein VFX50_14965, partial [Gemmatimonadales bacterium]|nr:hypothetical protein [Gemmatimonadales bacterium]
LAGTTANPDAVGQVYNVAVGDSTTLNQLFDSLATLLSQHVPAFRKPQPVYRDFRAGDVRFSRADISKIESLLGYVPTLRVHEGLERAIDWYVARLGPQRDSAAPAVLEVAAEKVA